MNQKEYRIYVVGTSFGYASWIQGNLTKKMKEADVVLFTGGEDISPSLYNEPVGRHTHFGRPIEGDTISYRDRYEVEAYQEARDLNIPMWGTCRGAQFLCAMAGGKLIQDMEHWQSHKLYFYDNEYSMSSNTLHHQMQYPYNMSKDNYKILAHAIGQSPTFLDGNNKPMIMPERSEEGKIMEPEFVYYPKIKSLGIQGHPEMMSRNSDIVVSCHAFLNLLIEEKLDDALALNLKVKDIISRAWNFKFSNEELAILKTIKQDKPVEIE